MTPSGFEGFSESPEAPLCCAPGRSPAETWAEAEARLVRVLDGLGDVPPSQLPAMSTDRIVRWHRAIFISTFPMDAGRLRADHEAVSFALPIDVGGEVGQQVIRGTLPRAEIRRVLDDACVAFEADLTSWRSQSLPTVHVAATGAARLYATILEVHPFVDGNLRAAFVALHAALRSIGLPRVTFRAVLDEHDRALGWAMRKDGRESIAPLADLIAALLKRPDASEGAVR